MRVRETIPTSPIDVEKSVRAEETRVLTTCRAGKIVPVTMIPLLREDRVTRGSINLSFEMAETIHPLMNSINVTAYAHFVPFLAFERFDGMDSFNRSYQGIPEASGSVIPFFQTIAPSASHQSAPLYRTMGLHLKSGVAINTVVREAYNTMVNFRRKARSEKLPLRAITDQTLAEAFWKNGAMGHIVPDYDAAMMDGEVELTFASSRIPVRSANMATFTATPGSGGSAQSMKAPAVAGGNANPSGTHGFPGYNWGDAIFAELKDSGVSLSLANIEVAKKTAAFAKLREQFSGLDDDHLIDLLMEGIRVPDESLKQPILLDRKSTIFGYSERHAMDGPNLRKSVTTGSTELTLNYRTPAMNTGGVIFITVEIVPEQLFERQSDEFLRITNPDKLPNFLRDYLDPEKVSVVRNDYVDVEHSTPAGVFGYAPLNHEWKRSITRVGGKYFRPQTDTFVEDRQRFWSVEQLNPTLTADFYMVPNNLPHSVFADTLADPFEILALGRTEIVGNTVFGKALEEDGDHYDAIMDQVDLSRLPRP